MGKGKNSIIIYHRETGREGVKIERDMLSGVTGNSEWMRGEGGGGSQNLS